MFYKSNKSNFSNPYKGGACTANDLKTIQTDLTTCEAEKHLLKTCVSQISQNIRNVSQIFATALNQPGILDNLKDCVRKVAKNDFGISHICSNCLVGYITCAIAHCKICATGDEKKCRTCRGQKCWAAFKKCTGLPASEPFPNSCKNKTRVI